MLYGAVFPPSKKRKRGGGYNFSMISKQIKHSNDHIKENQVRKEGGSTLVPLFGGNTVEVWVWGYGKMLSFKRLDTILQSGGDLHLAFVGS